MSACAVAADDKVLCFDAFLVEEKPQAGDGLNQLAWVLVLWTERVFEKDDLLRVGGCCAAQQERDVRFGSDRVVVASAVEVEYCWSVRL